MKLTELLKMSVEQNASDLHISAGLPPMLRIDGDLVQLDLPVISHEAALEMFLGVMDEHLRHAFATKFEVDFALSVPDLARFRVNVFTQDRGVAGAMRTIPEHISTLAELGMPKALYDLATVHNGLVLLTGPTGSGKSTTLAAILDYINENQAKHIITIEDPIEFLHTSKKALINQREVKRDTLGFNQALRSALREDPNIILVGELRDLETIRLALTAAETGHLVFSTVHTASAAKTIDRIIDVFPGDEKAIVRTMLSEMLQAVISQTLIKKVGGGRVAALEILLTNPAVSNSIREAKIAQIYSIIQTNANLGMITRDQHLKELVKKNLITVESARAIAVNKEYFA